MTKPTPKRMIFTSAVEFGSKKSFPEGSVFAIIGPFESHMDAREFEEKLAAVLREHNGMAKP